MKKLKWTRVAAACAAFAVAAQAQALRADEPARSTQADQTSLHITIYNQNFGLVKDVRELSLPIGCFLFQSYGMKPSHWPAA